VQPQDDTTYEFFSSLLQLNKNRFCAVVLREGGGRGNCCFCRCWGRRSEASQETRPSRFGWLFDEIRQGYFGPGSGGEFMEQHGGAGLSSF
jgi:hypothetical protein